MDKLLTFSVAAYNVDAFLENTLGTLADPRLVDKLEVFVVDDGGKDRSLEIARSFESRFPGTFHPVHKENGGYGSTVNYSISHASGKFFKLLDGDDWIDTEGLCKVLSILENCDDDIIVTEYCLGPSPDDLGVVPTGMGDGVTVSVKEYDPPIPHGMWALFYKTEILRRCALTLPEHTLYTDQLYSTIPFSVGQSIRFINTPVYCYRVGREEQSTSKASRIRHAEEMFSVCDTLYRFYDRHKGETPYILRRISRYYVTALKTLLLFPPNRENRKRLMQYERAARRDHPEIYRAALDSGAAGKLLNILRKTGYSAYWLVKFVPDRYLT